MISRCPKCGKGLNLTESQLQKIENALAALAPGKTLKFNCPHCQKPIEVSQDALTPPVQKEEPKVQPTPADTDGISPPGPPSLDWLERGDLGQGEIIEDIPQVLLLIKNEQIKADVHQVFEDLGYKPVMPHSAEDAIGLMRFTNYEAVVFHPDFEGSLAQSTFHAHMQAMSMMKRRYIFYVLVGPDFHTMYNLEALAYSANLVINENELSAFPLILKKGLRDYDELFGPYLAALETVGKK